MAYGYNAPFMMSNYQRGMTPQQPMMQMQPQPQMTMQMPDNQQFVPTYQPQMQPMAQPIQQPASDMMIFVLGESEATAYPVAPNNHVVLWDKNNPTIYVKSVNAQGVPSMRILDFNERTNADTPKTPVEHKCECGGKFVPIDDFRALEAKFEALEMDFNDYKAKPPKKVVKKIVEEEAEDE